MQNKDKKQLAMVLKIESLSCGLMQNKDKKQLIALKKQQVEVVV